MTDTLTTIANFANNWQVMFICLKDNTTVWFCSLHRKPSAYMKNVVHVYDLIKK